MLPIAPIVSSVITFIESVLLVQVSGTASSLLRRALKLLSFIPSFDSRVQLILLSFCVPAGVLALLVFPFSSQLVAADMLLAGALGFSAACCWIMFACVLAIVAARVVYMVCAAKRSSSEQCESGLQLAADIREYYMTGITGDRGESCTSIAERINAYCHYGTPAMGKTICNVGLAASCAVAAVLLAVYSNIPAAAACGVLAAVLTLYTILAACPRALTVLYPLVLRVVLVVLEALYIPIVETLAELLHCVTPCNQCVRLLNTSKLPFTESQTVCTACELQGQKTWRHSPFAQPWLCYGDDVMHAFGPFVCFLVVVVIIGLPAAECYISFRALSIMSHAYTVGNSDSEKYMGVLSMLHTPAVYTFVMYKMEYVHYVLFTFAYKLFAAVLSHVQVSCSAPFALLTLYTIQTVLTVALRPYNNSACFLLSVIMCLLNVLVSTLPIMEHFGVRVPPVLRTVAAAAASCIPVVLLLASFVVMRVRRVRMERMSVIEIDGVEEDGCVVCDRVEQLCNDISKLFEKDVFMCIQTYSHALAVCGGLASGYFFGCYI